MARTRVVKAKVRISLQYPEAGRLFQSYPINNNADSHYRENSTTLFCAVQQVIVGGVQLGAREWGFLIVTVGLSQYRINIGVSHLIVCIVLITFADHFEHCLFCCFCTHKFLTPNSNSIGPTRRPSSNAAINFCTGLGR